ncbi:hypothetical protein [Streptomyces sp. ME19-01-6]|uniref:hypothetical protein n=1 Tax=Streptomyces sp. ME19-01-6 TaxID=3028686 RepID=UPI0029BDC23E|nr:hypothetical protein [Streptomyces sp. ME19-01-6]MDX3232915.1 hypothetical protein [Streptomyces sp. ME19-01-6]
MTDLFQLADEPPPNQPGPDANECHCQPGDTQYLLAIEEGQAVLLHAACGKKPSALGEWRDLVDMNPIPVTVEWESECDGSEWHGDHRCDCNSWAQVTATSVPKDVRVAALNAYRQAAAASQQQNLGPRA